MSSYRDWYVGMKVVFIRDPAIECDGGYGDEIHPERGKIYTIRDLGLQGGKAVLRLVEIVNTPHLYACDGGDRIEEIWYCCHDFRPVQPRKTDISWATSMLTGAKERERA